MGVILGVTVREEPSTDGYLRGQLWNRPRTADGEYILFRVEHYNRFSLFGLADVLGVDTVEDPIYDEDGAIAGIALPENPGRFTENFDRIYSSAGYQCACVYIQRITESDPEGYPRLCPPKADRVGIAWVYRAIADRASPSQVDPGIRLNNVVVGFRLKDLIAELDGDQECRIAFSSRTYSIEQVIPPHFEGTTLAPSTRVSMQSASKIITTYNEGPYLDVDQDDELAYGFASRVERFAGNAPIGLDATGRDSIYSFILNTVDRSLSRSEVLLARPSDSTPIPLPSWGDVYLYSFDHFLP